MVTRFLRSGSRLLFWLIVFLVLLSVAGGLLLGLLTGVASAQEMPLQNDQNESVNPTEDCKVLDGTVYLCDKELEDGTAVLEFYSTESTSIKLGDAGVFLTGGKMNTERYTLNAERKETIEFDVSVENGKSGVAISTTEGQFGEPLDNGMLPELPGSPSSTDWIVAIVVSLFTTTGIIGVLTWWFKDSRGGVVRVF